MGAANFCYDNRCVIVKEWDLLIGNYPHFDEYRLESLLSYPSLRLDGYNFTFWELVITSGYYKHACIDYVEKPGTRSIFEFFSPGNYSSVQEFCEDVHNKFKDFVSKGQIDKFFFGPRDSGKELYDFLVTKFYDFAEYAAAIERKAVDAAIDKIKDDYGYEEYAVSARFSNSET